MRATRKYVLLASLFFAQGVPLGFFSQALPVLLRRQRVSLALIGLVTLLAFPWAVKFLWAPLVDRTPAIPFGRRRIWILPLQLGAAIGLAILGLADPGRSMIPVLLAVPILNLIAATEDIATDALAIDILPPESRGVGNGVQGAGYRMGLIIGGSALLVMFAHHGWRIAMFTMAAIVLLAGLPIALHREAGPHGPPPRHHRPPGMHLVAAFARRPGMKRWLIVVCVLKFSESLALGMVRPFFVDLGVSVADIGWCLGAMGATAGMLGSLVGGAITSRMRPRRALVAFATLQSCAVGGYVWVSVGRHSLRTLYAVCGVENLACGMTLAALFTAMMDACRRETCGTDYAVQSSVVLVAMGSASAVSGLTASLLGYTGHFLLGALLCLAGAVGAWSVGAPAPRSSRPSMTSGPEVLSTAHR